MSIIVKGMNIPELYETYKVNFAMTNDGKIVMGMCPLNETGYRPVGEVVTLPDKHGDLIDRDAFRADYGMNADCVDCEKECRGKTRACEYDRIYSKMDFCGWLDDAPTIVEEES